MWYICTRYRNVLKSDMCLLFIWSNSQLHTHEMVEVCAKILYQVELVRETLEQMWGFSVEAELIENAERQDELCCYVSRVEDKSVAMQSGQYQRCLFVFCAYLSFTCFVYERLFKQFVQMFVNDVLYCCSNLLVGLLLWRIYVHIYRFSKQKLTHVFESENGWLITIVISY